MKTYKIIFIIFAFFSVFTSCREEMDVKDKIKIEHEPTIKVESSVTGTVLDGDRIPLEGALVKYGDLITETDENGIFKFHEEVLYADGTYLTVLKAGFFEGSRRFYPTVGSNTKITIELIPHINVGSFESSLGGLVEFEKVEINFGKNGIVDEDNNPYNGEVKVSAKYLDPSLLETLDQMPGDLTAIDSDGSLVALMSYSMIAVELTDLTGNKLQLKEGETAITKFPIPISIQNSAPETIPLWSFDENIGIWVEEGVANLIDGFYEGEVSHFSFWNCDAPYDFINLTVTLLNDGIPYTNTKVVISVIGGSTSAYGYSDTDGNVSGFVPKGVPLLMEVFDVCDEILLSANIGPFLEDEIIVININNDNNVLLSGTTSTCGISSLSSFAYIQANVEGNIFTVDISDDGSFESLVPYCSEDSLMKIRAIDPKLNLSSPITLWDVNTDLDIGNLEVCDTILDENWLLNFGDEEYYASLDGSTNKTFIFDVWKSPFPVKYAITATIVDWETETDSQFLLLHKTFGSALDIEFELPEYGFTVSGTQNSYIVEDNGFKYIIFSGTLTDFDITDEELWDDSYDPFTYHITVSID